MLEKVGALLINMACLGNSRPSAYQLMVVESDSEASTEYDPFDANTSRRIDPNYAPTPSPEPMVTEYEDSERPDSPISSGAESADRNLEDETGFGGAWVCKGAVAEDLEKARDEVRSELRGRLEASLEKRAAVFRLGFRGVQERLGFLVDGVRNNLDNPAGLRQFGGELEYYTKEMLPELLDQLVDCLKVGGVQDGNRRVTWAEFLATNRPDDASEDM
jgi:hypothetical protein